MIMDAESRRLYNAVVLITVSVVFRTLVGYASVSIKELGIIAWH